MKRSLWMRTLCVLLAMLMAAMMLVACNDDASDDGEGNTPPANETLEYSVTILDMTGEHVSDVIVKVMKGEEQIKMFPYRGQTQKLTLDKGSYTLELDLSSLEGKYTADAASLILTPEAPATTVRLVRTPEGERGIYVGDPISRDYTAAYLVEAGTYHVTLTQGDYTFLVFAPTVAATYTFTYECESELTVSYHGSTFFVQGRDLTGVGDDVARFENGISINVYPSNIGGDMVVALKSNVATSCTLHVKNAGDPGTRLEDQPWRPYTEAPSRVAEQLAMNPTGTFTAVDLTDLSLKAVLGADGYYHVGSADGALLYIDLTSSTPYIPSIQTICANQRMGIYVYDASGNVIEKRSYNELFLQYGMPSDQDTHVDEPIRVALTEKLAEAIIEFGNKYGWWVENSDTNIFASTLAGMPLNVEYAWLLYCGVYV